MFWTRLPTLLQEAPGWMARGAFGRGNEVVLLRHGNALGDTLMLAPLARNLKRVRPDWRVAIASRWPELFIHNPSVDESRGWHLWRTRGTVQARYKAAEYASGQHAVAIQWARLWREIFSTGLARESAGVPALTDLHPEIFLTADERTAGKQRLAELTGGKQPAILVSSGGKTKPTHNREWGASNFQALVDALGQRAACVQISGDDPLLDAESRKPLPYFKADARTAAAVFAAADMLVIQEGGQMHLARAVDAPAVVIFGGYVLPELTGYAEQTNLWAKPRCSPCVVQLFDCPHLQCMVDITPRRVLECVLAGLERRGVKLEGVRPELAPAIWTPPPFVDQRALAAALAPRPWPPTGTD